MKIRGVSENVSLHDRKIVKVTNYGNLVSCVNLKL